MSAQTGMCDAWFRSGATRRRGLRNRMTRVTARAPASLVAALRRQSDGTQEQPQHQPRSASGASHRPGSHRMTERISSSAVKGALRFATPLRALDGTGAGCARRKNAAKKKTNRNQTAPATRARIIRVWPRRSGSKKPRRGIFYGRESASGGSALREAAPRLGLRRFGGELGVGSTCWGR